MLDKAKTIDLPGAFSKGFVYTESDIDIKHQYGTITENLRIKDGSLVPRPGYELLKNFTWDSGIITIKAYGSRLVVVTKNRKAYLSTDSTLGTYTHIGTLDGTGDLATCDITVFGEYIMFWYGETNPKVYDVKLNTFGNITQDSKSIVAEVFTNRQWIVFNKPSEKLFTIYGGTPVGSLTKDVGTTYTTQDIYEFSDLDNLAVQTFNSEIVGLTSTLQRMYVLCDGEIHEFYNEYLPDINGKEDPRGPKFHKIYEGVGPMNNRSIVTVNDVVIFLGKDKQLKAIKLSWGVNTSLSSVVTSLSEGDYNLQDFLNTNLNDDQSEAFGYYYSPENLVKFHLRSKTGSTNDIVIIWDVDNKTWLIDKNKDFTTGTSVGGKFYTASTRSTKVYQDEKGLTDDGASITIKRKSKKFNFGADIRKAVREFIIAWKINLTTNITLRIYTDDELAIEEVINSTIVSNSVAGIKTIDKLYDFRRVLSRGDIFEKGYTFYFELEATGATLGFAFSRVWFKVVPLVEAEGVELTEK